MYIFTSHYDPYYGFSVISAGTMVNLIDNNNGLFRIEDKSGRLLGTISVYELDQKLKKVG